MTTIDLSPLYRSTVGFDRLFGMLENTAVQPGWPSYDIEKQDENAYRISMAVAGFGPGDVELTQHGAQLLITGQRRVEQGKRELLHQGIAARSFKQVFNLADHVRVEGARLEHGLLLIDLVRDIPEQLKPRRIDITSASNQNAQLSGQANAPTQLGQTREAATKAA